MADAVYDAVWGCLSGIPMGNYNRTRASRPYEVSYILYVGQNGNGPFLVEEAALDMTCKRTICLVHLHYAEVARFPEITGIFDDQFLVRHLERTGRVSGEHFGLFAFEADF